MSMDNGSPDKPPTIRRVVFSCGCVVTYDETGCCRHYDRKPLPTTDMLDEAITLLTTLTENR